MRFSQDCRTIELKQGDDYWTWKPNSKFTVKNATITLPPSLVYWETIAWCNHFLPRYEIILWFAIWKRMNTPDILWIGD